MTVPSHLGSLNWGGLAITGGLGYLAGPEYLKMLLPDTSTSPVFKPMTLDTKKALDPQTQLNFKNIVDAKPMFKRAFGGNMNYREIANKFREKRAAAADGKATLIGGALREFVRPAMQAVLYGLGAGALASTMYDKYQDYKSTQNTYTEMFERFPELAEIDTQRIDDYWGLMSQYAPSMTHNPLVAGQFIKNMNDYDLKGVDFPTLKNILDIENVARKPGMDILTMISKGVGGNID